MKNLLIIVAIICTGCTNQDATRRTLLANGFTEVKVGGWSLSCGRDDTFCTSFSAINPQGVSVKGAVGCGLLFKGCTVRF
jgi:hypothetical protein